MSSSMSSLLNTTSPPALAPPALSSSSSSSQSALDFLAEAAMAGFPAGGSAPSTGAAPASNEMEGVESTSGSHKTSNAKQYHLDSSFFPAAPEPSFLPPPQQQRAPFALPPAPSSSSNNGAHQHQRGGPNGHLSNGQHFNQVPNSKFAATAASQRGQSTDPSDIPIPAHLLNWGAEEPLSAAERVKIGRRKAPVTATAPVPAPHHAPASHASRAPPSHHSQHAHSHQSHASHHAQAPSHHQPIAPYPSSSHSMPQQHNGFAGLPQLPKKEKKPAYVPPAPMYNGNHGFGQVGTPNGSVRPPYHQDQRLTSEGASESGTNSSGTQHGSSVPPGSFGPDGLPIKTGRKRVLGPDGKPMKKVKVPGRGQAWRKGLGGVGTGSAAPKLSTPLELFTAPSGPPRPKKPKKPKNPEDANSSVSTHGHNPNDPSGSSNGNNSMPPGEKPPKAPKPKVSKPGTHPKKAMPKFGPELPPNWAPTNLPIAQRPRDPTPPPAVVVPVEPEEDLGLYCVCETRYDEDKAMMACDKCQEWYHPDCVGIAEEKIELVDQFVCPKCLPLTSDRTTWKIKCRSQGCFRPIIPPLTKYCSPSCGVTHLTAIAAAQAVPLVSLLPRSAYARRPGGTTVAEPVAPAPALSSSPSSGANYPSSPDEGKNNSANHPLLTTLHSSLEGIEKDIKESAVKLDVVSKRIGLLGRASERSERIETEKVAAAAVLALAAAAAVEEPKVEDGDVELPAVDAAAEPAATETKKEKASKSKGKKPETNHNHAAGERICGFDRRLVLGEREFEQWCGTDEGRRALAGEDHGIKAAGEDVEMKEEGVGSKAGWWCEETRKKCDGHAGWQRWRLVDFQMEQQQKEEHLSRLEKRRNHVKKEIHDLEAEVETRRRLEASNKANVALPTSNERGGLVASEPIPTGRGVSVPSSLLNSFARGGSAEKMGSSYGSYSGGVGSFVGGFSSERGGFSNERGGVSNERGGDADDDIDMEL